MTVMKTIMTNDNDDNDDKTIIMMIMTIMMMTMTMMMKTMVLMRQEVSGFENEPLTLHWPASWQHCSNKNLKT
eukprot:3546734-Karenia_brevis.AAC.1